MIDKIHFIKLFFIFLLCLFCASCSNTENSYFPLNKGYKWQYDVVLTTRDGVLKQKYILNNIGKAELDGALVYLRQSLDGTALYYSASNEGIYYLGKLDSRSVQSQFNEDKYLVIPEALFVGAEWEQTTITKLLKKTGPPQKTVFKIIAEIPLEVKIESMSETVNVVAGRFKNCMKITMSGFAFKDAGNYIGLTMVSVEQSNWYAPDVGLVKMERLETTQRKALDKGSISIELAEFESG
jgi:hypothetical protein